jgi:RNA polymerase sigma-70 factor (ECF subfamily)
VATTVVAVEEDWIAALRSEGYARHSAEERLHELLLRAARFEVSRRRGSLPHLRGGDLDDVAMQSADDALVAVLAKLDDFRGESRFTTWAYKFALLEAAVKLRRLGWQNREVPLEPESWDHLASRGTSPERDAEQAALLQEIQKGIEHELSDHQREVLVAVTLNGVPIDVLAERLDSTRGALYKTLHDARKKLRSHLARRGMSVGEEGR